MDYKNNKKSNKSSQKVLKIVSPRKKKKSSIRPGYYMRGLLVISFKYEQIFH
jgi:hypothetical protein